MAIRETRAPRADAKEAEQLLALFERTARARQLYAANHTAIRRLQRELIAGFDRLLGRMPELSLKVRADAFMLGQTRVLEQPNPDESLPFLFYRDGVRRLDFHRGLSSEELEVVIDATVEARKFNAFGDDIVAYLWRHDLEHVRYVVVDTTIVDSPEGGAAPGTGDIEVEHDIDAQIDGLLRSIYGDSDDDVGPRSVHVDATDIPAKAIATQLDAIDEMAPGFHPPRVFINAATYAPDLLAEEKQSDKQLAGRLARRTIRAWGEDAGFSESASLADALLRIYDAALVDGAVDLARFIVGAVKKAVPASSQREAWLDEALAESRLRQVVTHYGRAALPAAGESSLAYFRACGAEAVGTMLRLVPSISTPELRRAYVDTIVQIGIEDVSPVNDLLNHEQAFVAMEAMHILTSVEIPAARRAILHAVGHEQAPVRLTAVAAIHEFPDSRRQAVAMKLVDDADVRVRIEASKLLRTVRNKETALFAKRQVNHLAFFDEPFELQATFLETFALLNQVWSLRLLEKYVNRAAGVLAKKNGEQLAVAAIRAMRHIRTPRTYDCLERNATSRSKSIRDACAEALEELGPRE